MRDGRREMVIGAEKCGESERNAEIYAWKVYLKSEMAQEFAVRQKALCVAKKKSGTRNGSGKDDGDGNFAGNAAMLILLYSKVIYMCNNQILHALLFF